MAASLLLHVALLWASASSSATAAEQCFSKLHPDLIVNASAAFLAKSTVLDARASPSQQACLLDCCSQEGFKCNWAVYKPDKPAGSENCYLFHCERQDDCPLIPMTDVNTYNILKGFYYPSKNHLTTTSMTTTQPTTTMTSLSTSNTQSTTTVTSLSTSNTQPTTAVTSLSTGNTPPTTITSLSTSKVEPTTMTSLSTSNTRPATTMASLSTSNTQQITIMKLLPTRNTQPTTTMTSLTPISKKPATTTTQLATIMMSLSTTIRQTKTTVTSLSTATSPLTTTTTQPATSTTRSTSTAARAVTSATQPAISSAITATSITTTTQPGTSVTTALQTTMTTTQATTTSAAFRKPFTLSITPLIPTTSNTPSTTTATARTLPTTTTTATTTTLPATATTSTTQPATTTQITTIVTKPTRSFIPMQVTSKIVALTEHPATSTEMQILKSVTAKKGHITNTQTLTTEATLSKSGVQTAAAITAIKAVNVTGKNHNKAARKQGTKAAEHSKSLGSATGGTALPVRLVLNPAKPSSAARPSGGPRKTGSRKPKTHMRTTARPVTLSPKVVTVMSSAPTAKLAAESVATRTAPRIPDKKPEHKAAGHVHPVLPSSNPAHANLPRRHSDHQGRLKSSLEVTVVVGLVFLTLAIALVGRKAMESFNRRQYTRLELNDLYYDV